MFISNSQPLLNMLKRGRLSEDSTPLTVAVSDNQEFSQVVLSSEGPVRFSMAQHACTSKEEYHKVGWFPWALIATTRYFAKHPFRGDDLTGHQQQQHHEASSHTAIKANI